MTHGVARFRDTVQTYWLWFGLLLAGLVVLLVLPGAFSEKSRALLHGLCAQTPAHSFEFGETLLPFDGRMTGIYAGVGVTLAWLVGSGRILRYGLPPARVMLLLGGFVAIMAVDGFNSLLSDLQVWHPYASQNVLRLVTGYGTGVTLAIVLTWLISSSLWNLSVDSPVVRSARSLVIPITCLVPIVVIALASPAWLHVPISILLIVSAWATLAGLALAMILLMFRLDDRVRHPAQAHVPGAVAMIVGLVVMLSLAGIRFWLERAIGIEFVAT